jgi:uncharacterized protein YkwD
MKKQHQEKLKIVIVTVLIITSFLYLKNAHSATSAEIDQWLQAHNEYRSLHGVPPVTWSETVAASAQRWADTCPSGHSGSGENITWANYVVESPKVVKGWYDEERLYDYNNPGFSKDTGHFTQVVWKSTAQIGCGYKIGCGGEWPNVWVCQYNPAGNVIGQFADNVFPKSSRVIMLIIKQLLIDE